MSKKIYLSIFGFLFFWLVFGAIFCLGQTKIDLPSPGLTPDSPFYFLEIFFEKIGDFFTFGDLAKAKRYIKLANERIAEAKAVVDKGKPKAVDKALVRYQKQLEKALAKAEKVKAKGKSIAQITDLISQATAKHLTVLEEVSEKVPKTAKLAILQAREASKTGQIKALEALSKEKPKKAFNFNIKTIQNRLEKIKKETKEGDEKAIEMVLSDFIAFQGLLEKMGKENQSILGSLVGEAMTDQIEALDKIEEDFKNLSPQMAERVKIIRNNTINGQLEVLEGLAKINPEKAAEIYSVASEKRLEKVKQKAKSKNVKEIEKALNEFEKYSAFGQEISEIAKEIGEDTSSVEKLVAKTTTHHLEVLNQIYNEVPEPAKKAIQKAMVVSEKGRQKAVKALKERGALEDIPERVPLPSEVKEKVFEKKRIPEGEEAKKPKIEIPESEGVEKIEKPEIEIPEKPKPKEPKQKPEAEKPKIEKPEISPGPPIR